MPSHGALIGDTIHINSNRIKLNAAFLRRGEKRVAEEKHPSEQENQPTCDIQSGNGTRDIWLGSQALSALHHHCSFIKFRAYNSVYRTPHGLKHIS